MITVRRNFPSISLDNEDTYIKYIEAAVTSVDFHAAMVVTRKLSGILFRISPSNSSMYNRMIEQINKINNNLGIKVEYSKSIKTSFNISFQITL